MARLRSERSFERYLLDGERPIFAIHRHWAVLAVPITWVVGLVGLLVVVLVRTTGAAQRALVPLVLIAIGFAVLRVLWEALCWRLEWFILTDKRLLLTNGVIDRRTGAMPLAKVTDLTYHQPFVGEILRFGTFVLESAGQQQAMHDIEYVPHTPNYYRLITAAVHAMPPDERDAHLVLPGLPWWGRAQLIRTATRAELIASGQAAPDAPDDSRAIPIQPPFSSGIPTHRPASDGEVLFESADIAARRRTADTGPIRYYPTNDPD